jgi:hypothetical protein
VELYVTSPAGDVHPVAVQLSMLLHPSVRTRGERDDRWWGAVAVAAAAQVHQLVGAGRASTAASGLPDRVVVRRFVDAPGAVVDLADGTMELIDEFDP